MGDKEMASKCHPPVWFEILNVFSNCLITLNSALNFFIYCLAGAKFRQGLSDLVCCRTTSQTAPPSTSHTAIDLKSYSTVQYSTVQYSTVQYIQYQTMICNHTVQYSTVQYSTVQYSTVQYSTVQYIQYQTMICNHTTLLSVLYME